MKNKKLKVKGKSTEVRIKVVSLDKLANLYKTGLSFREIGRAEKINWQKVRRLLLKHER